MSLETLQWMHVGHIFGFVMWIGTMLGLFQILLAHAEADATARGGFGVLEKRIARAMDVGATITLVFGVTMLVVPKHGLDIFKAGAFFHVKLALVVALLGAHGFLRAKVKKFGRGEVGAPPAWMFPVLSLTVLAIIILIVVRPFAT